MTVSRSRAWPKAWSRVWPRTLVGRTVLVLLAAVVLSNLIGLVAYLGERREVQITARERAIAERVVLSARLLEESSPDDRRRQAWSLRGAGLRMGWAPRPLVDDDGHDGASRGIRRAFADEQGEDAGDRLRLAFGGVPRGDDELVPAPGRGHGPGSSTMPAGMAGGNVLRGSLRLGDGSWLNFVAPMTPPSPAWSSSMLLVIAATTLAAAAIAAFAVWRASAPLSMFAAAAARLGRDLDAPPLREEGPAEVDRAARAFNEMQARLRRMIHHRMRMLAAMSHDLRTPITRLKLRAELLADEDQQAKMLADLDQIEALVNASLDYVRDAFSDERAASLDLAVLVRTICDEAEDAGAAVTYAGPEHAAFTGRPVALRRAVANLVDNATKFAGAARVALTLTGAPPDDAVEITVVDKGPGLPEAELTKVFDPFYRLEGSRNRDNGGAGLGLAIVEAAAKAHDGTVTLANREAGGLRAILRLPRRVGGARG